MLSEIHEDPSQLEREPTMNQTSIILLLCVAHLGGTFAVCMGHSSALFYKFSIGSGSRHFAEKVLVEGTLIAHHPELVSVV